LKVDFQGSRVTSDGGLLLVRELDERLGLSALIAEYLTDSRGKNTQLPMADLLRQAVYTRLAGYEGLNRDTRKLGRRARTYQNHSDASIHSCDRATVASSVCSRTTVRLLSAISDLPQVRRLGDC